MNLPAPISATVEMNAGSDEEWRVVSDVARMPEFSLNPPMAAVASDIRRVRWQGAYELEPTATGTAVTCRRVLSRFTVATYILGPALGGAEGHDAELAAGIRTTLERIRASLEAS